MRQYKCIHARADNNKIWCTHCGQEEPKLVYTLFWCKPVCYDLVLWKSEILYPIIKCNLYILYLSGCELIKNTVAILYTASNNSVDQIQYKGRPELPSRISTFMPTGTYMYRQRAKNSTFLNPLPALNRCYLIKEKCL